MRVLEMYYVNAGVWPLRRSDSTQSAAPAGVVPVVESEGHFGGENDTIGTQPFGRYTSARGIRADLREASSRSSGFAGCWPFRAGSRKI